LGFVTESDLVFSTIPSSSVTPTLDNPDDATSTIVPVAQVPLPSNLPESIFPPNALDTDDPATKEKLQDYTLISLLFGAELSWAFVVNNPQTTGQLFAYTPQAIASALGIPVDDVITYKLQVFVPTNYAGNADDLRTTYLAFIPTDLVPELQAQVTARNSGFYQNSSGPARQIANLVDPTYSITSVANGPNSPNVGSPPPGVAPSSNLGTSNNTRRNAIIGVCATIGGIIFLIGLWFAFDKAKQRREQSHQRLVYGGDGDYNNYGAARAQSPQSPPYENPFQHEDDMAERRRSFFFAEDSLRGYVQERDEEPVFMHRSPSGSRRGPIQTQAISNPILRESSLNW
jgi:hypothetical protein